MCENFIKNLPYVKALKMYTESDKSFYSFSPKKIKEVKSQLL